MSTDNIIQHIVDGDVAAAKSATEALLYNKLQDALQLATEEITPDVYKDAVGVAGLVEKKKNKDENEDDEVDVRIKDTGKEDDGDGLDAVGAEDSEVDNDGDSDESDDYLNNRRKTVGKSIKKKKNGDDEDEELDEAQVKSRAASRGLRGVETSPDLQNTPGPGNTPSPKALDRAEVRRKLKVAQNTQAHLAGKAGHRHLGG